MKKTAAAAVLTAALFSTGVNAGAVELERLTPEEAPVEQCIASGKGVFWTLQRRQISRRGQTMLDGVIVASEESGLQLKVIQRRDGDHRVAVGPDGKPGRPVAELEKHVKEMRREQMIPYRLDMGKEIVAVYAPHGAQLKASPRKGGALIDLEIKEDVRKHREPIEPFAPMAR